MDSNPETLGIWSIQLRLLAAVIAGALLGWEREWRGKPAGLRTHMLVSLGAAVFMVVTVEGILLQKGTQLDSLRVVAGIAGGIGFLGAGTIIRSRGDVEGITTAANIWVAAAIGTACGMGFYVTVGVTVVLTLVILVVVDLLKFWIGRRLGDPELPLEKLKKDPTSKSQRDKS